ncbi:MAG: MCE family protein [Bdellovibrionales bacterium CG10_big_fil_rev_8_21_14_0_10_45_34]|nr:MAG: MCE family protein [Bdellovibrionales bacterium CG10_big_fil_rev_8_21_14_0_10_45_34]
MNGVPTLTLRVGFVVAIISGLIVYMAFRVSENPSLRGSTKSYWFLVGDASGLVKKGSVKTAGIDVGIIEGIDLRDGQARVEMLIRGDLPVKTSARVTIKSLGILGDRYVELFPGSDADPLLGDNGQIGKINEGGSLDKVMGDVSEITDDLKEVAQALKSATQEGDRVTALGRIVDNIEKVTQDLSEVSRDNKQDFREIVSNVREISDVIRDSMTEEGEQGFRSSWRKLMASVDKLDRSMGNIEDITRKINTGEGTLGKLVNDDTTIVEVNKAVDNVNLFLGDVSSLQTSLDLRSEYQTGPGLFKSYLGLQIQPGQDRYYLIQVVDDPTGVIERVDTTLVNEPGGTTTTRETKVFKNKVKFSAMYAKYIHELALRGGLIESSGGFGVDYHFFRRQLRLSFDAFEFTENSIHLRAFARFDLLKGLYLIGGFDDFSSREGNSTSYFGAGLDFSNDDLTRLLSRVNF